MNASPKTTSTKPAICSSRNWSREEPPADERRAGAEEHEDGREAERRTGRSRRRRAAALPGSPSRSASTAETAER